MNLSYHRLVARLAFGDTIKLFFNISGIAKVNECKFPHKRINNQFPCCCRYKKLLFCFYVSSGYDVVHDSGISRWASNTFAFKLVYQRRLRVAAWRFCVLFQQLTTFYCARRREYRRELAV